MILPDLLPNAFAGLFISVVIYAVGGGLIEVLISLLWRAAQVIIRKGNEPSAFLLLLGSCGSGPAFHDLFPYIWN